MAELWVDKDDDPYLVMDGRLLVDFDGEPLVGRFAVSATAGRIRLSSTRTVTIPDADVDGLVMWAIHHWRGDVDYDEDGSPWRRRVRRYLAALDTATRYGKLSD